MEIICAHEPPTLNHSILQSTLAGLTVMLLSLAAGGQESSSTPVTLEAPHVEETSLVPSFRVAHFRLETLDLETLDEESFPAPDEATSSSGKPQPGLVKRSIKRIGEDQKRLYLAPFEAHNLKWDALVLVGTGAFLAADRHIENNVPHSHFTLYQTTSDIAIAGLSGSPTLICSVRSFNFSMKRS